MLAPFRRTKGANCERYAPRSAFRSTRRPTNRLSRSRAICKVVTLSRPLGVAEEMLGAVAYHFTGRFRRSAATAQSGYSR
jgi:hypothetical protein